MTNCGSYLEPMENIQLGLPDEMNTTHIWMSQNKRVNNVKVSTYFSQSIFFFKEKIREYTVKKRYLTH